MFRHFPGPVRMFFSFRHHGSGVGVVDPGRDAIHFESHWGGQDDEVGSLPPWLQGLELMPLDQDPISRFETVRLGERRMSTGLAVEAKYLPAPETELLGSLEGLSLLMAGSTQSVD